MIQILRIEDVNGGGLYRGENRDNNPLVLDDGELFFGSDKHPIPWDDSRLMASYELADQRSKYESADGVSSCYLHDYHYGFSSPEQMRSWIYKDQWLKDMGPNGFRLAVFEMDERDVLLGNTQACFLRENAKTVTFHDAAEFFNLN